MTTATRPSNLPRLAATGGFVGRQVSGSPATDADDVIAWLDAGPFCRALGNDVYNQQRAFGGFEFHAQADKVAFNLRIQIVQLAAREERAVFIQSAQHGSGEFHHRGRRLHCQVQLRHLRCVPHGIAGIVQRMNRVLRPVFAVHADTNSRGQD